MKNIKNLLPIIAIFILTSCASTYNGIDPASLQYESMVSDRDVVLQYKYEVLPKKYAKKERKRGVRVVAYKIINNSDRDLVFGTDLHLEYANGKSLQVMSQEQTFKDLKQHPATHLLYLLLSPVNLTISNNRSSNSYPIGLAVGPGLAAGNLITASSANGRLKEILPHTISVVA